jgi:hypothetical protein
VVGKGENAAGVTSESLKVKAYVDREVVLTLEGKTTTVLGLASVVMVQQAVRESGRNVSVQRAYKATTTTMFPSSNSTIKGVSFMW